jgi:hypothetical protein
MPDLQSGVRDFAAGTITPFQYPRELQFYLPLWLILVAIAFLGSNYILHAQRRDIDIYEAIQKGALFRILVKMILQVIWVGYLLFLIWNPRFLLNLDIEIDLPGG